MRLIRFGTMVALAWALSACGGGGGGCALGALACGDKPTPTANAPVAKVGADQSVLTGLPVMLDASGSTVNNGATLTYAWVWAYKPSGSKAILSSDSAAKPTFTPDVNGTYSLVLTVYDGREYSAPVVSTIQAAELNVAPVADAGTNQSVMFDGKSVITLDGSASWDKNSDALTYNWTLSVPDGSKATLSSTAVARPGFVADKVGTYVGNLVVSDGKLSSNLATVRVVVSALNAPPVANAGVDQNVMLDPLTPVMLDGSASTDANQDPIFFSWSMTKKPVGSTKAALDVPTSARPKFTPDVVGSYEFSLVVNDGKVNSLTSSVVTVTASAANAAPVANAGPSQKVVVPVPGTTGVLVTLDGSGSKDANPADKLTYKWTLSKPAGSDATLSSDIAISPTFNAKVVGTYVAALVVNDGKLDSPVSLTSVTAVEPNVAPVARIIATTAVTPLVHGNSASSKVSLDGTGSTDGNPADTLSYTWVLSSKPPSSVASIAVDTLKPALASFTADMIGNYIVTLQVSDGTLTDLTSLLIEAY